MTEHVEEQVEAGAGHVLHVALNVQSVLGLNIWLIYFAPHLFFH